MIKYEYEASNIPTATLKAFPLSSATVLTKVPK